MADYVLVPGGGHGGWCYTKIRGLLGAAGHGVHAPSLSGLADRSHQLHPGIDLETHITDVVDLLFYEDLRDVILVGHSYAGMVITGVAGRAADRIGKLVYLDAANPANGQSLLDVAGPMIEMARSAGATVEGVELVLLPGPGAAAFYGVTDPGDQAWMDERLTGHPWKCFEQKLQILDEAAYLEVPRYHIVCTSTLESRDPDLIEEARRSGRLWTIDAGHDLMVTEPDRVAEALLAVAAA